MFAAESFNPTASFSASDCRMVQIDNPLNRRQVKQFIQRCFRDEYDASVDIYADNLIALLDYNQQIQAAVGYQSAADGPLFLEQYLDQPIEQLLSQQSPSRSPVRRDQILEVGNLASHSNGWTRQLILSLAPFYYRQGFEWLVITVTPQVLNTFHKLGVGLELIPLTAADPDRLDQDPERWGRYYKERPLVMAGHIGRGIKRLKNNRALLRQLATASQPLRDRQILIER